MTVPPFESPGVPRDLGPGLSDDAQVFVRIENLMGEEDALLRIPSRARTAHDRERLRLIGEELDRAFERLRARAGRAPRVTCGP
jgi:hypothetical protein